MGACAIAYSIEIEDKTDSPAPNRAADKPDQGNVVSPRKKSSSPQSLPSEAKAAPPEPAKAPSYPVPDMGAMALNLIQAAALGQKAARLMVGGEDSGSIGSAMNDARRIGKTMLDVATSYVKDPLKLVEAQAQLWNGYIDLLQSTTRKLIGQEATPIVQPARADKRFKDPDWQNNVVFDLMKQSYLLASQWLDQQVRGTEGVDEHTRKKAEFYVKQFANAFSPSNFLLTNPEVLRTTLQSNGENLVLGMQHLLEDVERGHGKLQIQQTDMKAFELGRNIALTPGKVVFQNDLIQLLQYEPTTEKVHKRPLLIFPPWINKYYILDLTPEKSFVKWAVGEGFTVFVVSWVNPDARQAMINFESYMIDGAYAALGAVEKATGEKEVNAIGYCIGGTLLASTLAHMAAKKDDRIKSATFFATQVDFTEAGDLQVFIDEEQIAGLEHQMDVHGGLLEGSAMASTFNMLRSNELIWSYVVNNYLLGREPVPFDLLYWNADATRMPAKMHLFYLRECYLRNNLAEGRMVLGGEKLDLSKIKVPIYLQSSREDHIAPYNSVYKATRLFGGDVKFIVAGSGHIAGVINPPSARKYQYWTNDARPQSAKDWIEGAEEHPGSWWGDWESWLKPLSGPMVPARVPGDGKLPVLENAPGSYVLVKSGE
ncbi:MAG: class I poly(R)-hydroxyalkanoic acid synthase [Parvibaculum sp.]|nr:class I poly(R)-hydroxyalkanoic acid synthase [Parvibaculum sp.]